jgi:hypothetical protein
MYIHTQKGMQKKGFGSGDFRRKDEFSNTIRTGQYRDQLLTEVRCAKMAAKNIGRADILGMSEEEVMELLQKMETLPNPDEVRSRATPQILRRSGSSGAVERARPQHPQRTRRAKPYYCHRADNPPRDWHPVQLSLYDRINANEEGQSVSKISRDSHNPTMKSYDRVSPSTVCCY